MSSEIRKKAEARISRSAGRWGGRMHAPRGSFRPGLEEISHANGAAGRGEPGVLTAGAILDRFRIQRNCANDLHGPNTWFGFRESVSFDENGSSKHVLDPDANFSLSFDSDGLQYRVPSHNFIMKVGGELRGRN